MNPRRVVFEGTDQEVGWACHCGIVYCSKFPTAKESATICCVPTRCRRCGADMPCGELCSACYAKQKEENRIELCKSAKKVFLKDYDGKMVYDSEEDEYISVEDVKFAVQDGVGPKWAWATGSKVFYLNAVQTAVFELENQDHAEEAFSRISKKSLDKLQQAMDTFCEEAKIVSYFPDFETVVLLEEELQQQVSRQEVAVACGSTT